MIYSANDVIYIYIISINVTKIALLPGRVLNLRALNEILHCNLIKSHTKLDLGCMYWFKCMCHQICLEKASFAKWSYIDKLSITSTVFAKIRLLQIIDVTTAHRYATTLYM